MVMPVECTFAICAKDVKKTTTLECNFTAWLSRRSCLAKMKCIIQNTVIFKQQHQKTTSKFSISFCSFTSPSFPDFCSPAILPADLGSNTSEKGKVCYLSLSASLRVKLCLICLKSSASIFYQNSTQNKIMRLLKNLNSIHFHRLCVIFLIFF